MKVLFAPEAEQDLNSAVDFLASRNPTAAARPADCFDVLRLAAWIPWSIVL